MYMQNVVRRGKQRVTGAMSGPRDFFCCDWCKACNAFWKLFLVRLLDETTVCYHAQLRRARFWTLDSPDRPGSGIVHLSLLSLVMSFCASQLQSRLAWDEHLSCDLNSTPVIRVRRSPRSTTPSEASRSVVRDYRRAMIEETCTAPWQ
jgi:hypothetical protein